MKSTVSVVLLIVMTLMGGVTQAASLISTLSTTVPYGPLPIREANQPSAVVMPPTFRLEQAPVDRQGAPEPIMAVPGGIEVVVNSTSDTNDGVCNVNSCSLREAIGALPTGGTIVFAPSIANQTLTLNSQLTITQSIVLDGTGRSLTISGGGTTRIFNITAGDFTCQNLTLTNGNAGTGNGGALQATGLGFVLIDRCTLTNNRAANGGAIFAGTAAGALVRNSTLWGNQAVNGGAVYGGDGVSIHQSTISGNLGQIGTGGMYFYFNEKGTILNNVIYGNSVTPPSTAPADFWGETYAGPDLGAGNITLSASGLPGVVSNANPQLQSLANNGGDTQTMALGTGSSALDAAVRSVTGISNGVTVTLTAPPIDQRGQPRPRGCEPDAGAVEITASCATLQVGGRIYNDANNNGVHNIDETWANGTPPAVAVFVNLVRNGVVVASQQVVAGAGTFNLNAPTAGAYTLIIAASATSITPAAPSNWAFRTPATGSLSINLTATISGQDLGLRETLPPAAPSIETGLDGTSVGGTAEPGCNIRLVVPGLGTIDVPTESDGSWFHKFNPRLATNTVITITCTDVASNTSTSVLHTIRNFTTWYYPLWRR